ncbi:hypothetical protein BDP81DRAFT_6674 [Colletotrichum phormii]|uniref:Uncharacterized protein n=1 Tax=Colletotrichum phormii TaxID=359342 RepID=A0AAJ0A361_9PEZI|nr:uncharacterized protein BDP81DRAFT_6674 [Colletotrichum phormii]KAK1655602.1 hypothetical protein BDP81DRAFT_6674 [Colletotrichum phormii]
MSAAPHAMAILPARFRWLRGLDAFVDSRCQQQRRGGTRDHGDHDISKDETNLTQSLTLHLSPMRQRARSMVLGGQEILHWPSLTLLTQGLDQGGLLLSRELPCIELRLGNLPQECLHIACLSAAAQPSPIKSHALLLEILQKEATPTHD